MDIKTYRINMYAIGCQPIFVVLMGPCSVAIQKWLCQKNKRSIYITFHSKHLVQSLIMMYDIEEYFFQNNEIA